MFDGSSLLLAGSSFIPPHWLMNHRGSRGDDLEEGTDVTEADDASNQTGNYPSSDSTTYAFDANGTTEFVNVKGNPDPVDFAHAISDKWSIFFFVRNGVSGDIISYHGASGAERGWYIELDDSGQRLRFLILNESDNLVFASSGIKSTPTWRSGYFEYDPALGATERLKCWYDNDTQDFTGTSWPAVFPSPGSSPEFRIGKSKDGSGGAGTLIGEVAIMVGSHLTAAERNNWDLNGIEKNSPKITQLWRWQGIPDPFPAPSNLTAQFLEGPVDVKLDWQDNSSDEDGFEIYRRLDAGSYPALGSPDFTVGADVETYTDTTVASSQLYWYRVRAYRGNFFSNFVEVGPVSTTPSDVDPPTNVHWTVGGTNDVGNLNWTPPNTGETGFDAEYKEVDDGTWLNFPGTPYPAGASQATQSSLSAHLKYHGRVRSRDGTPSAYVVSPGVCQSAPAAAPTSPNLQFNAGPVTVDLWNTPNGSFAHTKIERATNAAFTQDFTVVVASTAQAITTDHFVDTGPVGGFIGGTTYWWRFRTVNKCGDQSAPSASVSHTIPAIAPQNAPVLTVTPKAWDEIDLDWTRPNANATGVDIAHRTTAFPPSGPSWPADQLAQVGDVGHYDHNSLAEESQHFYMVRDTNATGAGPWSNAGSAITFPRTPRATDSDLVCRGGQVYDVILGWEVGTNNVQQVRIEKNENLGGWVTLVTLGAGATAYTATSAVDRTDYRVGFVGEGTTDNFPGTPPSWCSQCGDC